MKSSADGVAVRALPPMLQGWEVFGSYTRGQRVHAIACRIEKRDAGRWQVVALHIG